MILIDFSQIMIANLSMSLKGNFDFQLDETRLRNMILHSVKHYANKFARDYGEMVICCDSRVGSWRREYFPYYKIRRARNKEKSALDWPMINALFDKIISELRENFPYRVVKVDRAEADDVIATLCRQSWEQNENTIIVSCDQDFYQLLVDFPNISMYNHIDKREVKRSKIPDNFLKEKIIRGDSGDDVPNILTQDDAFAIGVRSKPMLAKRLAELLDTSPTTWTRELQNRYERNRTLVDLALTPQDIQDTIIHTYNEEAGKGRSRIYSYLVKYRLKDLVDCYQEF